MIAINTQFPNLDIFTRKIMFKSGKNNVINMQLILYTVLEAYHVILFPHF